MKYVLMTTAFGNRDLGDFKAQIPNLFIVTDYHHDAMGNFLNALSYTDEPFVLLEDDAELCNDFCSRIEAAIQTHPDQIINFFSLRKKDYEMGEPFAVRGGAYLGNVCVYFPAGYGVAIADFYKDWSGKVENPTGNDLLVADWLKSKKLKYIQWFPHLVNHKVGKSLIDPRRSSQRTDKNFEK